MPPNVDQRSCLRYPPDQAAGFYGGADAVRPAACGLSRKPQAQPKPLALLFGGADTRTMHGRPRVHAGCALVSLCLCLCCGHEEMTAESLEGLAAEYVGEWE